VNSAGVKLGYFWRSFGRKFSHRPDNPATVGVVRWPAAGDTAGSSLRRLSSLQHKIYNLLEGSTDSTLPACTRTGPSERSTGPGPSLTISTIALLVEHGEKFSHFPRRRCSAVCRRLSGDCARSLVCRVRAETECAIVCRSFSTVGAFFPPDWISPERRGE